MRLFSCARKSFHATQYAFAHRLLFALFLWGGQKKRVASQQWREVDVVTATKLGGSWNFQTSPRGMSERGKGLVANQRRSSSPLIPGNEATGMRMLQCHDCNAVAAPVVACKGERQPQVAEYFLLAQMP